MKKINLLLLFLLLACALPAQDGISVFIGRANRYASVELSDYRKRLCLEYNISNHSLDDYYRRCGNDWGNVGIALEIARTSGKKMRDVCDYYKRYHRYGWNRILVEIGIKPGSMYYNPFYNRVHHHSDCWHEYYNSYCERHDKFHHKKHKYKKPKKHHKRHCRHYDDDDDDDGKLLNPKMDKAITIMGIVTAVIIVIVIIYLALSVAGVFKFGGKKNSESQQTESQTQTESESESETQTETEGQMIDIRGMSVDDAQKAVDRLKLDLTVFAFETKQSDEKDGTILDQDVKAGDTVKRGSQINVVIAGKGDSTSEMVKIPSVIGKTKSSAKSTLESAGFSVTFEYGDYNNSVAADVVTAQSPSAKNQAAKGSTVTVTLSPGQKPITVPNVVGASQSQAESALAGAGLKYTYADSQYSDTVAVGNVISQTKSGETVAAGTTITLTLSKGKQEISTNVSKGISYSGEGTVVKAEYKLVGKSGTVYDKGSYENTSSFTVSGTMKEATGSIVVTWTVQTGETDEAGNPATVTLDPVTYSVP